MVEVGEKKSDEIRTRRDGRRIGRERDGGTKREGAILETLKGLKVSGNRDRAKLKGSNMKIYYKCRTFDVRLQRAQNFSLPGFTQSVINCSYKMSLFSRPNNPVSNVTA
jgi:hypothetical protein